MKTKCTKPKSRCFVATDTMLRREIQRNNIAFLYALERSIKFHRDNVNDPHGIGQAVMVALTEVRDCFKAYIC